MHCYLGLLLNTVELLIKHAKADTQTYLSYLHEIYLFFRFKKKKSFSSFNTFASLYYKSFQELELSKAGHLATVSVLATPESTFFFQELGLKLSLIFT